MAVHSVGGRTDCEATETRRWSCAAQRRTLPPDPPLVFDPEQPWKTAIAHSFLCAIAGSLLPFDRPGCYSFVRRGLTPSERPEGRGLRNDTPVAGSIPEIGDRLGAMEDVLGEGIDDVRSIMSPLRPSHEFKDVFIVKSANFHHLHLSAARRSACEVDFDLYPGMLKEMVEKLLLSESGPSNFGLDANTSVPFETD
jgi:hypothetical protein